MPHGKIPLYQHLEDGLSRLPMHMPGHKRNTSLAPYLKRVGAGLDITEINGFDNLHDPKGLLKESMALAASVFGANHTIYSVNGSTAGILAGVGALTRWGDTVLVARNCHLSVINALRLFGLRPVFVHPPMLTEHAIYGSLSPTEVEAALDQHPDARLLICTSPTYEGVISDIAAITSAAHRRGVPVLVDEAHGAHLGLSPRFPGGSVKAGADVVVQSLHKTLPSLTQTAVIHVRDEQIAHEVKNRMRMLETSSPSYLLLASLDGCVRLLAEQGATLMEDWYQAIAAFHTIAVKLQALKILDADALPEEVFALDLSKLLVCTGRTGITGHWLAEQLRLEYAIECEMAQPRSLLALTGMGDTEVSLSAFANALLELDKSLIVRPTKGAAVMPLPETVMPMDAAAALPHRLVPLSASKGCVCAEVLSLYPPGAPLLVPGERVTGAVVDTLTQAMSEGVTVLYEHGDPEHIAVVDHP